MINKIKNKCLKVYTSFAEHEVIGSKLDDFLLKVCYYFLGVGVIVHMVVLSVVLINKFFNLLLN